MAKVINGTKEWQEKPGEDFMVYLKRTEKMLDFLMEESRRVDLNKTLVGVVLQFPKADGYAIYKVVKDSPSLVLEHIPFSDAWRLPDYQIRGLRKADVKKMAQMERDFEKIFEDTPSWESKSRVIS